MCRNQTVCDWFRLFQTVERSIINLWVDNKTSESDIAETCEYISDLS